MHCFVLTAKFFSDRRSAEQMIVILMFLVAHLFQCRRFLWVVVVVAVQYFEQKFLQ